MIGMLSNTVSAWHLSNYAARRPEVGILQLKSSFIGHEQFWHRSIAALCAEYFTGKSMLQCLSKNIDSTLHCSLVINAISLRFAHTSIEFRQFDTAAAVGKINETFVYQI